MSFPLNGYPQIAYSDNIFYFAFQSPVNPSAFFFKKKRFLEQIARPRKLNYAIFFSGFPNWSTPQKERSLKLSLMKESSARKQIGLPSPYVLSCLSEFSPFFRDIVPCFSLHLFLPYNKKCYQLLDCSRSLRLLKQASSTIP